MIDREVYLRYPSNVDVAERQGRNKDGESYASKGKWKRARRDAT